MPIPEISANENGWTITPPTGQQVTVAGWQLVKLTGTFARAAFTDGGAAAGTLLTGLIIPVGAIVIRCAITAITGFAGDTSAVITIGDGTDVDRYNTGTPDIFTTIAAGIDAGIPSGLGYHAAQKEVKLTVTSAADFTNVSTGSVTIEIYYLT
jgi:hypothetical protein